VARWRAFLDGVRQFWQGYSGTPHSC